MLSVAKVTEEWKKGGKMWTYTSWKVSGGPQTQLENVDKWCFTFCFFFFKPSFFRLNFNQPSLYYSFTFCIKGVQTNSPKKCHHPEEFSLVKTFKSFLSSRKPVAANSKIAFCKRSFFLVLSSVGALYSEMWRPLIPSHYQYKCLTLIKTLLNPWL